MEASGLSLERAWEYRVHLSGSASRAASGPELVPIEMSYDVSQASDGFFVGASAGGGALRGFCRCDFVKWCVRRNARNVV